MGSNPPPPPDCLQLKQPQRQVASVVKADLSDLDRVDMLSSKVQILEQIATDAVAAIRLLNALVGFGKS